MFCYSAQGHAQLGFSDQSVQLGVADTSRSYGLYWGDINNDGYPDLYSPYHYNLFNQINPAYQSRPTLFLNQSGLTFTGVEPERFNENDYHGAAFFKFEDDDLMDFLVITGGGSGELLFRNPIADFSNPDTLCGPCQQWGRGRNLTLLDYNYDGRLDLVAHHVTPRPEELTYVETIVFDQNSNNEFENNYSHLLPPSHSGLVGDVDNDGECELVTLGNSSLRIFDFDQMGFNLIYEELISYSDAKLEDFDNNGTFELLLSRISKYEKIAQIDDYRIEAYLKNFPLLKEFTFNADSNFEISVMSSNNDFLTYAGMNDSIVDHIFPIEVDLSSSSYNCCSSQSSSEFYMHIEYDDFTDVWKISTSGQEEDRLRISIRSTGELSLLTTTGISSNNIPDHPLVLKTFSASADSLIVVSDQIIDHDNISGMATGDFDNDGDLDLITSNYNELFKEPYAYYSNDGLGNLVLDTNLTSDLTGVSIGHTDAITTIDYNRDGALDFAAVNGWGGEFGTIEIFKNTNDINHWMALELEGIQSNKMGIGSLVTLYSNGIMQSRLVNGGLHGRAQDDMILHFGLATNSQVDSLIVDWPSGISTTKYNLNADTLYTISETTPEDLDGDGILNNDDNCPELYNPDQELAEFYFDGDGDGFGNPYVISMGCNPTTVFVDNNLDCNDDDAEINPNSPEVCDGIDNNCSGDIDEGFITQLYYADLDQDGFGDPNNIQTGCIAPAGYVDNDFDCDDTNTDINPDKLEFCDGLDNDCNGVIDDPDCDQCVPSNFTLPPTGLFEVQTSTTTQLKWNHYSDYQEGCLVSTQRIDTDGNNIGNAIKFAITGLSKISSDANGHNKSGAYAADQEFIKFNQNTYPSGNTASWVPGANYKWRVKCACVIDNSIPKPNKVWANNLHTSPWSEWSYFANLSLEGALIGSNSNESGLKLGSDDIHLYPNPSQGLFNITFRTDQEFPFTIAILNLLGEEVFTEFYSSHTGINKIEIDLSGYPSAVYMIHINGDGTMFTRRLMKNL